MGHFAGAGRIVMVRIMVIPKVAPMEARFL